MRATGHDRTVGVPHPGPLPPGEGISKAAHRRGQNGGDGDPIAFELFKNAIFSIADEMALTVMRTILRRVEGQYGLLHRPGRRRRQVGGAGSDAPGHLGSIPTALESIMRQFGDNMGPGDIFIMNDPFDGGMHLPDIFVIKPLYVDGRRVAFAAQSVTIPMSGSSPGVERLGLHGGLCRRAAHRADEDVQAGKRNDTLFTFIEKNVRVPVKVFGDLRAQLAACHIAERQFLELVGRYGAERVNRYMQEVIDYAERLTRAAIAKLPDGVYRFEDWIDDDGIDVGKPIRLFVTLTKRGQPHRRLDRQLTAGQGGDQQYAVVYQSGDLLCRPLRPASRYPEQ